MDKALFSLMNDALQAMVPYDLKAKGWRYLDFNARFSPEAWRSILAIMGEGEYQILITSEGTVGGQPWIRGQFFVSPKALENLKDKERRKAILDAEAGTDAGAESELPEAEAGRERH